MIGAWGDDDNGDNSGSAYVFEQQADGTWQQIAKLTADDGASNDEFSTSVAIDGGVAVIGAQYDDDNGYDSGSVYVFEQQADGTWQQIAKLTADDGAEGDWFGSSVALDGDVVVIGAQYDDDKPLKDIRAAGVIAVVVVGIGPNHRHATRGSDAVAEVVLSGPIIRREFGDLLPGAIRLLLVDIRAAGGAASVVVGMCPNHRHAGIDGDADAEPVALRSIIRREFGDLLPGAVRLLLVDIGAAGFGAVVVVGRGRNYRHARRRGRR